MSTTHGTTTRGNQAQQVIGDAGASAVLVILTSGGTVLASFSLNNPIGTRSGATVTMSGTPKSATAAATGTAAKYEIRDGSANMIVAGSVATSGGDATIDNVSITSGQTVNLNSYTYTSAP